MRPRRLMNQINVVPYIDVMLVLLVIFMVTAPMVQTGTVDLPSVAGVAAPKTEAIVVTIKKDGDYTFQASATATPETHSIARLEARLSAALKENAGQSVIVAADKTVAYDEVMKMLDSLRRVGFEKVGLQTRVTGAS